MWDVTGRSQQTEPGKRISTHTSRVGCDALVDGYCVIGIEDFYSHIPCGMWRTGRWLMRDRDRRFLLTHPVWDVTQENDDRYVNEEFLLTHPVWDVTKILKLAYEEKSISTHTSRVGCDSTGMHRARSWRISTHTSRVGCDIKQCKLSAFAIIISTHTSRVGCDDWIDIVENDTYISTHTSRVGCDRSYYTTNGDVRISTHTSRVGCDFRCGLVCPNLKNFYSHIPCGMWRRGVRRNRRQSKFLLTHPVWDVTAEGNYFAPGMQFLLTHPVWDVTEYDVDICANNEISTHTSRVGCDRYI